jgi:hypothetical protein
MPLAGAKKDADVVIVSHEVNGNTVEVTLYNPDLDVVNLYVRVDAKVNDQDSRSVKSASVFGYKTTTVTVGFAGTVTDVVAVGIVNEGPDPF